MKKYLCEFIGTAVLVLFGCGTAAITGGSLLITALAFGLSIVAMAYVIGNVSGCHINPAVSLAMLINGKITLKLCTTEGDIEEKTITKKEKEKFKIAKKLNNGDILK